LSIPSLHFHPGYTPHLPVFSPFFRGSIVRSTTHLRTHHSFSPSLSNRTQTYGFFPFLTRTLFLFALLRSLLLSSRKILAQEVAFSFQAPLLSFFFVVKNNFYVLWDLAFSVMPGVTKHCVLMFHYFAVSPSIFPTCAPSVLSLAKRFGTDPLWFFTSVAAWCFFVCPPSINIPLFCRGDPRYVFLALYLGSFCVFFFDVFSLSFSLFFLSNLVVMVFLLWTLVLSFVCFLPH